MPSSQLRRHVVVVVRVHPTRGIVLSSIATSSSLPLLLETRMHYLIQMPRFGRVP